MLRIVENSNVGRAKSYYSTADYYSEGQELQGIWRGEGAKQLGLLGTVSQKDWDALCDNLDPNTGKTLTARQKSERRIGWDFNFHVPKSVSLLYGLTQDERILDAFRESVRETMTDIEAEMKTRVRRGGKNEDRTTGNAVWGEFIHFTARPVEKEKDDPEPPGALDGKPDPHLHAHCFLFNTTWDESERRWKAAQIGDLKRDAPYFEAMFHSRMTRKLAELGVPIVRRRKSWDIAGISEATLQKFSRRTAQVEAKAKEKGITDPNEKAELGAETRSRKRKEFSMEELRDLWRSVLTSDETSAIEAAGKQLGGPPIAAAEGIARKAIDHAIEHCFVHKSVVPECELLAEAMWHSMGSVSKQSVIDELRKRDLIRGVWKGRDVLSTKEVLAEENRLSDYARKGRGSCRKFVDGKHVFKNKDLNAGQRKAVQHVLSSRDAVTLIRGAAGTGKTWMMREAVEAIEKTGTTVFTFAPSTRASKGVLREQEGFANADTVAQLLNNESMQRELRGQAAWIDEAGFDSRTMARVFDLAKDLDFRVILSGDRRQHGSVERGSVLRLLEEEAGIVPAELKEIQRQKGDYKKAVEALSEGLTNSGFVQLDKLGWIKEVAQLDRYKRLADDYLSSVAEGKTALVVSPTHFEGDRITNAIRAGLKASKKLDQNEKPFTVLENLNLTPPERADAVNYVPGDVLVFHQNAKGFKKGERVVVGNRPLPLDQAARFQVFHPVELKIAAGEAVRVTRNGFTKDGKRLDNGTIYAVNGFTPDGDIQLEKGGVIDRGFGFLDYGYVVTSHASQGSTVDRVFIGQSSDSFAASSREQFYVSVSRARHQATVFTDDKETLLNAVRRSDDRVTATELVAARPRQQLHATLTRSKDRIRAMTDILPQLRPRPPEELAHAR